MKFIRSQWTPLFFSNFLGVFNDNFLKTCIIFISINWTLPSWLNQSQLISAVSAALVVPYLFFSPLGGRLAVIYSKKAVFRLLKLIEIPIMMVASLAFYFHWVILAVLSVLILGTQSCLYSPAKYSLIRDIGGEEGVSFGSGIFEMMAFLGILTATIAGSAISDLHHEWVVYSILLGVALLGYGTTRLINAEELPENKEGKGTLNPARFLLNSFRYARTVENVNTAVLGASSFWLIGGMLQMNLVIHTSTVYHTSNTTTGFIMASAAIGIAAGTGLAGKMSGKTVKRGLILPGIITMTFFLGLLTFVHLPFSLYTITVFIVATAGGFFQIPNLSMLQNAPLGRRLGDMIAYLNSVTFIFILIGTLLFSLTTYITHQNSYAVFGVIAGLGIGFSLYYLLISDTFRKETRDLFRISRFKFTKDSRNT